MGFTAWKYAWVLERLDADPPWVAIEQSAEDRRRLVEEKSEAAKDLAHSAKGCRRKRMLEYLGTNAPESCERCDLCVELPRPWADSHLTREGLLESLPVNAIITELVESTVGARYSFNSIVNTLAGDSGGNYEFPKRLAKHHAFGRLAFLKREGVEKAIDKLVEDEVLVKRPGEIKRPGELERTQYKYLEIAE